MMMFKDMLALLKDIEDFNEAQDFPEAENLIQEAKMAIEKDRRLGLEAFTGDRHRTAVDPL